MPTCPGTQVAQPPGGGFIHPLVMGGWLLIQRGGLAAPVAPAEGNSKDTPVPIPRRQGV